MFKKNGVFYFEKFLAFPQLIHGFSTRQFGSMRPSDSNSEKSREKFLNVLRKNPSKLIRMNQVHGNTVSWVTAQEEGAVIETTDGLLTKGKDMLLGVITADCVPLLLYDSKKGYCGVIHAGWRGVYNEIVQGTIKQMIEKGSESKDIVVGIGPSIRVCCYEVDKGHFEMFTSKFPQWNGFLKEKDGKSFFDLSILVKYQLQSMGIRDDNIEDSKICTADTMEDFYSYRKEGKKFGEFMGVIGIK